MVNGCNNVGYSNYRSRAAEPSTNGRPVRLKLDTLIVYSILWVIATTWQASAVHVIKPFSFESVKKIKKKTCSCKLENLTACSLFIVNVGKNDRRLQGAQVCARRIQKCTFDEEK